MTKPQPKSLDPDQLVDLALAVIQSDRFPYLATMDGRQPRVRPVSPVRTDRFDVYMANLRSYQKTVEIQSNPRVELCYLDSEHNQLRITGTAEIVTDRVLQQEIWDKNALLRQFLGSIDNPQFILYHVSPSQVRYMREWALEYHEVAI